jgi:transcription elongation factor GreB
MGRFRSPPQSSGYITPEGAAALKEELRFLLTSKRPLVTKAVAEAAAQGDRSENAEYIYGKKQLREIDRRIRHLRKRLEHVRVVDQPPRDRSRVYFGAWFQIEDAEHTVRRFRLVGPDEFDRAAGYISMDSPLGKAVTGKALHEQVTVRTPAGATRYTIIGVDYEDAQPR